jgi:LPS-assembly protein
VQRGALAVLLSVASFCTVAHADEEPMCPTLSVRAAAQPAPRESKPDPNAPIQAEADSSELGADGNLALRGHVEVHQGDREMHADNAQYDRNANALTVKGGVEYSDPIVRLSGADGHYSPSSGANVTGAQFQLLQRSARGTAQELDVTPEGILHLKGVTFTTCPKSDHSWQLRAGALTLDTGERIGTGKDARIDFKGVPILYLPWVTFPLGNERKSGFLFPSIGNSSRGGVQVEIPYYFNIAPNADLTLDPTYYSKRGVDLAGDARFLTHNQSGELQWHFLPNDQVTNENRSFVTFHDVMQLPEELRLRLEAANVSDLQYFQDFGSGPEGTSVVFLQRLAQLTYRDEYWNLGLEAQQYQTIAEECPPAPPGVVLTEEQCQLLGQQSELMPQGPQSINVLPDLQRPYARLPRMYASGDFGWGPQELLHYGFDSELVDFSRSVGVTGWRIDVMPKVAFDFENPGYFVRSSIAWRYTQYELDNTLPGANRSPSRSLPVASVDSGLLFDRTLGARNENTLTLEPRMMYLYVPYRNQDQLPLFDTALPDLNMVQLFRPNRYVGADRVSDADELTVGVTSRLLNTTSGEQYIAATLGQTYYFETPRVQFPGEELDGHKSSDLIAELALTAYRNWNVDLNIEWKPASSQAERTFVQLQYHPAEDSVVNIGYRYQRSTAVPITIAEPGPPPNYVITGLQTEGLNQAEMSGAWPVSDAWNVLARAVYDINADKALDTLAGFEYRACCWRVRLLGRRYLINGTGQQDTAVLFQVQLTGLAGVGPASDTFLGTAIRGYSPPSLSGATPPRSNTGGGSSLFSH